MKMISQQNIAPDQASSQNQVPKLIKIILLGLIIAIGIIAVIKFNKKTKTSEELSKINDTREPVPEETGREHEEEENVNEHYNEEKENINEREESVPEVKASTEEPILAAADATQPRIFTTENLIQFTTEHQVENIQSPSDIRSVEPDNQSVPNSIAPIITQEVAPVMQENINITTSNNL